MQTVTKQWLNAVKSLEKAVKYQKYTPVKNLNYLLHLNNIFRISGGLMSLVLHKTLISSYS